MSLLWIFFLCDPIGLGEIDKSISHHSVLAQLVLINLIIKINLRY